MKIKTNGEFVVVLDDGTTLSVARYDRMLIDGLEGDLADRESFTARDGCVARRHGDEVLWSEPPKGGR